MAGKKARARKQKKVKRLQQEQSSQQGADKKQSNQLVKDDISTRNEERSTEPVSDVCPHHNRRRARPFGPRSSRVRQRQQRPLAGHDPSKDAILLTTFDGVAVLVDPSRLWMLPSQITMPHIMKHTAEGSPRLPGVKDIGSELSKDTHLLSVQSTSIARRKKPWEISAAKRDRKRAAFNVACAFVLELQRQINVKGAPSEAER
jgi:hypothetical protein